VTRFEGPAGAIFVAVGTCIATSELMNGPCWWLAWSFGAGGALLLIGEAIRAYIDRVDGSS
jgi:hypothetical protein